MQVKISIKRLLKDKKLKLWLVFILFFLLLLVISWGLAKVILSAENQRPASLNHSLPEPHFNKEADVNKLSFYEKADEDSLKRKQLKELDPYYAGASTTSTYPVTKEMIDTGYLRPLSGKSTQKIAENASALNDKIAQAEALLRDGKTQVTALENTTPGTVKNFSSERSKENLKNGSATNRTELVEADPQMAQLDKMMDKIIAIQHPEKQPGDSVLKSTPSRPVSRIHVRPPDEDFMGADHSDARFLDDDAQPATSSKSESFLACVDGTQKLSEGSILKIRLLNPGSINGVSIPAGMAFYGRCSIGDNRMQIEIPQIKIQSAFVPVRLSVYDLDGFEGLHITTGETLEALKNSGEGSLQSLQLLSLDPSFKAQAASAGIQAAKGMIGRKVKRVNVQLPDGYRLFLQNKLID